MLKFTSFTETVTVEIVEMETDYGTISFNSWLLEDNGEVTLKYRDEWVGVMNPHTAGKFLDWVSDSGLQKI